MKIAAVFSAARWRACWATTYTFEPSFFESFLLRRLGEPPWNAVLLGDAARLSDTWAEIGDDAWRVPGLNHRYLVRGVNVPGGAFHAKTVLFGNDRRGVLLVGSGNIGLAGLESGQEFYARFDLEDDPGAFAAWRRWMGDLVGRVDDPLLRSRWADLHGRLPWLGTTADTPTAFETNADRPLIDSFLAGLTVPVDELHVTAPFFDHRLDALRRLVRETRPSRLVVYVGDGVSVDGPLLAAALDEMGVATEILAYRLPPRGVPVYVHAKAIAAITGAAARIMTGSANLSGPALLRTAWATGANVEAATIEDASADAVRALFAPDGRLEVVPLEPAELRGLTLATMAAGGGYEVNLVAATRRPDGFVDCWVEGTHPRPLVLSDGATSVGISGGRTVSPFAESEATQFVWLAAETGEALSNRVPIDEVMSLDRMLVAQESTARDRPRDLDALDVHHPLGRILFELHQAAMFDVDDTPAAERVASGGSSETRAEDAEEFWARFFREELGRDPRATRYGALGRTSLGQAGSLDEFGALLLQMLESLPAPNQLRLLDGSVITREDASRDGVPWTDARRIRARAFNVLARWCRAVADPRVRWLGEFAAVSHYEGLLGALGRIWPQATAEADADRWLTEDQLARVYEILHGAFVRTERSVGYLAGLSETDRAPVVDALRVSGAPALAAAMAFAVLRSARPATYFAWQPFLVPGLELGVLAADERSVDYLHDALGIRTTVADMERVLERAAVYIDDERWCERVAESLGIEGLSIVKSGNPNFPTELRTNAIASLRTDPRVPGLIRLAASYLRGPFRLSNGADLMAVTYGGYVSARLGGEVVESVEWLTDEAVAQLEATGSGLAPLFPDHSAVA
jgi:hypothetical protein